ncbi:hypothetical protein Q4I28_008205 [Leishmania naiffi]|uniref:Uncharacterized protein n=1 Tax=Leishmania naiffi TaxID=5678 RepID=A0AAW3B2W2_9TRYP
MPRNLYRIPVKPQSNMSAASKATPTPVDDTREKNNELASLPSTSVLPTRAKHRGRGRPRTYPSNTSSAHSLHPHLALAEPGSGDHEETPTATASLPTVSNPTSTAAAIVDSATAMNHLEVIEGAETFGAAAAASAELLLQLPLAPLPVSFSSSRTIKAQSLVTTTPVDTVQGELEAGTISSRPPSHSTTRGVATVPASMAAEKVDCATLGAQPLLPSMAACMAACFGWRLKRCCVGEGAQILFALQHRTVPVVHVTIEGTRGSFMQECGVSGETDDSALRVNGTLMSLTQCAAYLQELTHALFTLSDISHCGPPTNHAPAEEQRNNEVIGDGGLTPSSTTPTPHLLTPNAEAKFAERRGKKRTRSRSSLPSAHSTASVPRAAELVSRSTVLSLAEASATVERGDAEASKEESQPYLLPLKSSNATLPPAPLTTPLPASLAATDVKVKTEPSLLETSPRISGSENDGDTQSLSALAALVAAKECGEQSTSLPRALPALRTNAGKFSAPSKRDLSLTNKGTASKEPRASSTVFAFPTMRQQRTLVSPHIACAAAGLASAITGAHHVPPASPTPPHVALGTATFTMPFAFHHASAAPLSASATPEELDLVSCTNDSKDGHRSVWCDSAGWSTDSSRLWLAHTHAVSRAFACMPVPCYSVPATMKVSEPLGGEGANEQRTSTAASASSLVPLMGSAAAAAFVRMTLRWRWRERSSMGTAMEDSLRMAVGSGHLRGDALEAGVQALQASEAEQHRYNGVDVDAGEDGSDLGPLCRRTAPDVGQVGHGTMQQHTLSFPACPPRALLPVSGRAIVEAQHRIAEAEEEKGGEESAQGPRYVACAGGIPSADRIVIDHTYSTRGSYVMAPPVMAEGATATPCRRLMLQRNPQEDLHYHVYKRVMPTDMRLAVEAEETLAIGSRDIAPPPVVDDELLPTYNLRHGQSGGAGDDNEDDEERDDRGDDADDGKAYDSSSASRAAPRAPGATTVADARGGVLSTDIDYVLRYRPSIRRIPMPDVESRYGP